VSELRLTADTWSLVASIVSTLLSVIAITLSVLFFLQGNKSNLLAQSTLTEVKALVHTIHQQAFALLKEAINRISPSAPVIPTPVTSPQPPLAIDKLPVVPEETDPNRVQMDVDMKALNELYSRLSNIQTQLVSPAGFVYKSIGLTPLLETELRRITDLIAVKRAQIEQTYGIKLDSEHS
jgi:hypothetical protein